MQSSASCCVTCAAGILLLSWQQNYCYWDSNSNPANSAWSIVNVTRGIVIRAKSRLCPAELFRSILFTTTRHCKILFSAVLLQQFNSIFPSSIALSDIKVRSNWTIWFWTLHIQPTKQQLTTPVWNVWSRNSSRYKFCIRFLKKKKHGNHTDAIEQMCKRHLVRFLEVNQTRPGHAEQVTHSVIVQMQPRFLSRMQNIYQWPSSDDEWRRWRWTGCRQCRVRTVTEWARRRRRTWRSPAATKTTTNRLWLLRRRHRRGLPLHQRSLGSRVTPCDRCWRHPWKQLPRTWRQHSTVAHSSLMLKFAILLQQWKAF